jgi:hypothetical protein
LRKIETRSDDDNQPIIILSERFKALLEELRTIDRVSDYTTAGFVEETEISALERKIFKIGVEDGLSGSFICDRLNDVIQNNTKRE